MGRRDNAQTTEPTPELPDAAKPKRTRRRRDDSLSDVELELRTLKACWTLLSRISDTARGRALLYLARMHEGQIQAAAVQAGPPAPAPAANSNGGAVTHD